jgi:NAD(P)-dependent dehydrogenase (short-subunit alcohol dehydrogenase family)
MKELAGRTAVITGAASGIGRAMAARFAGAGMNVVLADIERARLDEATEAVRSFGVEAQGVVTDVSEESAVFALRDAALARFGAVHLVCNNAGVGDRSETIEEWHWVIGVNLWGVVHGMRAFLPLLVDQSEGHVVNTASVAGLAPAYGAYSASKWAVVGITQGAYLQMRAARSPVGLSCLCPGFVQTDLARSERSRPAWAARTDPQTPSARARLAMIADGTAAGRPPSEVADLVHDAVVSDRFWVYPHPDAVAGLRPLVEAMLTGENPPVTSRRGQDANGLFPDIG